MMFFLQASKILSKYPNVKQEVEDAGYESDIVDEDGDMHQYPYVWIGKNQNFGW